MIEGKADAERFKDLMWEAYQLYKKNPHEIQAAVEDAENNRCVRISRGGCDITEFGLALWTLQLISLKDAVRRGIAECTKGGETWHLLGEILKLLETSPVNRDIGFASWRDVMEFLDAAETLSEDAKDALVTELYNDEAFLAVELLKAYMTCLRERVFREFDIVEREMWLFGIGEDD